MSQCVVCLGVDGHGCKTIELVGGWNDKRIECTICGTFSFTSEAIEWLAHKRHRITAIQRAALSHLIRKQFDAGIRRRSWTDDELETFFEAKPTLPTPVQQATSIIRLVGDEVNASGVPLSEMPISLGAKVGSANLAFASSIAAELVESGKINAVVHRRSAGPALLADVSLTLRGWEIYEQERRGQFAGSYGFVALKFGDSILDPLLRDHIKPAIKEIGFDLVDLRDVSRAGVIDNLLRIQLRDAAFVLVDLTHENAGAYWEAGYAEGLGKPVLYLCEKIKFDEKKTHFDTNHCTTILWDTEDIRNFKNELIATLRRTLEI
jgi:hypothetical protein